MSAFGSLSPFGLLVFGDTPSRAEPIYDTLRQSTGGSEGLFRDGGWADCEAAATAVILASSAQDSQNALDQQDPTKTTALLPYQEEQAGIQPNPNKSDAQRRAELTLRTASPPGLHPAELLAYLQQVTPGVVSVSFPVFTEYPALPDARAYFSIDPNPTPSRVLLTEHYGVGDTWMIIKFIHGAVPVPGITYHYVSAKGTFYGKFTVTTSVPLTSDSYRLAGTYAGTSLPAGLAGTTSSMPYWVSNRRRCRVAVTSALASNRDGLQSLRSNLERILPAATVFDFAISPGDTVFTLNQDALTFNAL